MYIMYSRCNEVNLQVDGSPKHVKVECLSYTYAQKMRAAATYDCII